MALNNDSSAKLATEWHTRRVVALAGGVGGAKLAYGLAKILPDHHLTVIVNTGDDFLHYHLHISPDLDTVMYTLADLANPVTGWGILHDTWQMVDMLKVYGETVWFNLGDRDLATHLLRTQALHNGQTLTQITQTLTRALGVKQNILPATDDPLATIIETDANSQLSFQEYFVKYRWQPRAVTIHYRGSASARATPAVLSAIEQADMLVICPSNPVLSIAPILQVQGLRAALENRHVPCVALSPLIGGKAVKGPADKIMRELGLENTQRGIAQFYDKLIDGLVIDTVDAHEVNALQAEFPNLSILITQTLMISMEDRVRLATEVLNWSTYSRKANL